MPKRSLGKSVPGEDPKKIDQLNRALNAMLSRADGKGLKVEAGIEPLMRIAAGLRVLPRESFKAQLKAKLKGRKVMATLAEPITTLHTSAAPRMVFKDAAKAIEFYKQALGAVETFRFEAGGSIPAADITIGNSQIMLSDEWPEGGRFSAETMGYSPVQMSMEVPDVDTFAERAVAAGMKVRRPLANQFYGHRDVMLTDPFGYTWTVYTVREEMSVEEMHRRMEGLTTGPEGGRLPGPKEAGSGAGSGVSPVPRGFRRVTPYLVAEDGLALLDFVKAAFGAEETERVIMPTGGVHGETRIGDSMLMMGGGTPGHKFASTLHPNALHVYVQDADEVCRKAVAAGATLLDEVRDQPYGERSGAVKDKAGNFWYVATAQGESYVPKGLHTVNPYLHPLRAEPLIAFLRRAFGAEEVAKYASPDGVVMHAQVKIGDSVIEMGEAQGKYERMPAMFYLYVPDSDALYQRALAAGAKSLHEPTDQPYGDHNSAVTDAFGNTWYIATHVKDVG
jgi:PhnB protein